MFFQEVPAKQKKHPPKHHEERGNKKSLQLRKLLGRIPFTVHYLLM